MRLLLCFTGAQHTVFSIQNSWINHYVCAYTINNLQSGDTYLQEYLGIIIYLHGLNDSWHVFLFKQGLTLVNIFLMNV